MNNMHVNSEKDSSSLRIQYTIYTKTELIDRYSEKFIPASFDGGSISSGAIYAFFSISSDFGIRSTQNVIKYTVLFGMEYITKGEDLSECLHVCGGWLVRRCVSVCMVLCLYINVHMYVCMCSAYLLKCVSTQVIFNYNLAPL